MHKNPGIQTIPAAPSRTQTDRAARSGSSVFRTVRWVVTFCLVGVSAFLFLGAQNDWPTSVEQEGTHPLLAPQAIDPKKEAEKFLREHRGVIERAVHSDMKVIESAMADLNRSFDVKREQIDPLLDELFTFTSKARMLYYYFTEKSKVAKHIEDITYRHLGGPTELAKETTRIDAGMRKSLERNHNLLILELETDLAALPYQLDLNDTDSAIFLQEFRYSFDSALRGMLPRTVGVQLGVESFALAADLWVAPVIGRAVTTALVSRGILSGGSLAAQGAAVTTGAAGSWATGGTSLIVGMAIAVVIDYAANEIARADAKKKLLSAFENWRRKTVSTFQRDAYKGIRHLQKKRRLALKKALMQEITRIASHNETPTQRR